MDGSWAGQRVGCSLPEAPAEQSFLFSLTGVPAQSLIIASFEGGGGRLSSHGKIRKTKTSLLKLYGKREGTGSPRK